MAADAELPPMDLGIDTLCHFLTPWDAKPFSVGRQCSLSVPLAFRTPLPDACEVNNLCQMSREFEMPCDVIYGAILRIWVELHDYEFEPEEHRLLFFNGKTTIQRQVSRSRIHAYH